MSTEHQKYSTDNQSAEISSYAERRGFEIVRTYADEGKSGLRIDGRDAFQRLLADIQSGTADFEAILVYDVSRWGRFQDPNEASHYVWLCKSAGINVHFCAEQVVDLYRFCAGHLSHYAALASNASGLMPPRYEWRRREL